MLRKKLSVVGIVMGGGSVLVSWFVKVSVTKMLSEQSKGKQLQVLRKGFPGRGNS